MAEAANIDIPITPVSPEKDQAPPITILSTSTPEIDYDYYHYEKENITEAINTSTSNEHFSILGLDKNDSIVLIISFAVITLCVVALVIAIVFKFKKIKCSFNIQKKSADIELDRMHTPLVQNRSLFDSVDLITPSDEI